MRSPAEDPFNSAAGSAHEWVQICAIVNAPAVMVFGWIGRAVPPALSWIAILFTSAGIFAQWYLIGLWRDESALLAQREPPAKLAVILWWVALVAVTLAGVLSIAVQVFLIKTSNAFLISLAIWCCFFSAFLVLRIRAKNKPNTDGSIFKI